MPVLTKPPRPLEWHCADCGHDISARRFTRSFLALPEREGCPYEGLSFQQVIAMAKEATPSGLTQAAGGSLLLWQGSAAGK